MAGRQRHNLPDLEVPRTCPVAYPSRAQLINAWAQRAIRYLLARRGKHRGVLHRRAEFPWANGSHDLVQNGLAKEEDLKREST